MIRAEALAYRHPDAEPGEGRAPALDGLSLTIGDGETVVLAGPNGAGKTTLLRQLNGLLEPDSGTVAVDGIPVAEDPVRARTRVSMTFQTPRDAFVAATVGGDVAFGPENLGLDRAAIDARVDRALAAVGMAHRADAPIATLSGGERARVAIAGALAMEPAHLLLDEPFTSLDWPSRAGLLERLRTLAEGGLGLVIVTHDLRDLAWVDRWLLLSEGQLVAADSPDRVRPALEAHGVRPPGQATSTERD